MARNRQRAKQRQARRREARLAERRSGEGGAALRSADGAPRPVEADSALLEAEPPVPPAEATGTGAALESPPPAPELAEAEEELVEAEEELAEAEGELALDETLADEAGELAAEPAEGRPGAAEPEREERERGRVVTFLGHVWAELQRVQWPDRTALTTLTAVVLTFVLLAGGYLGLLDAIFSRIIQAIL